MTGWSIRNIHCWDQAGEQQLYEYVSVTVFDYSLQSNNKLKNWPPRFFKYHTSILLCVFVPTTLTDKTYGICIIITKNVRYLLWNRGFWCSLNNTYPIFLTLCIRCISHLCDSCDLTDVIPHVIPSLPRMSQNVDPLWCHRYKSRPPAIVTSQWPIVPAWLLWTLY